MDDDLRFIEANSALGTYTIEVTTADGGDVRRATHTRSVAGGTRAPTQRDIWTATLTVQAEEHPTDFLGCWSNCSAALDPSYRFAFGGQVKIQVFVDAKAGVAEARESVPAEPRSRAPIRRVGPNRRLQFSVAAIEKGFRPANYAIIGN